MKTRKAETITRQELLDSYVDDKNATVWMASNFLGCSYHQLRKALTRHGLKAKPKTRFSGRKTKIPKLSDREWLKSELKTKSYRQIAKELGTSVGNVADRVYRYGIRCYKGDKSQAIKMGFEKKYPRGRFGKLHPNWHDGASFKPHTPEFNGRLKQQIKNRDGNQCQFCGTSQNGRDFPVHHIDYNKENCNPINLITLCDPHHTKTNYSREKWQFLFEVYQEIRI